MALTWDYINKGADCTPEFVLRASGSSIGEQILLFQILRGCYGSPTILEGISENGQASEVLFGFGAKSSSISLDTNVNIDNLSLVPEWSAKDALIGKVERLLADDDQLLFAGDGIDGNHTTDSNYYFIKSRRQVLFFNIKEYDLIKDYNPQIIVERYSSSKSRGTRNKSVAGFKKVPNRKNRISITGSKMSVDFDQEKYFRPHGENQITSRNRKNIGESSASAIFHFKIELTINGKVEISEPLSTLRLQARIYVTSSIPWELLERAIPDGPQNQLQWFCSISYKMIG